ncbi:MAG: von Willebrand factor type A domain-containing protein [Phycisphaerales bacterium]
MTTTPNLNDDPRLTAYALGELDAGEASEVERLIETDADARRAVDEIRATAASLRAEFGAEPSVGLTDEQRGDLKRRVDDHHTVAEDDDEAAPVIAGRIRGLKSADFWIGAGLSGLAATLILSVLPRTVGGPHDRDLTALNDRDESTLDGATRSNLAAETAAPKDAADDDLAMIGGRRGAPVGDSPAAPSLRPAETASTESRRGGEMDDAYARGGADEFGATLGDRRDKIEEANEVLGEMLEARQAPPSRVEQLARERSRMAPAEVGKTVSPRGGRDLQAGYGGDAIRYAEGEVALGAVVMQTDSEQEAAGLYFLEAPDQVALRLQDMSGRILVDQDALADRLVDAAASNTESSTEDYARITDNPFRFAIEAPLSTFSIDVDTASYSNVRRFLIEQGQAPPPDAVRIEELINYFDYDYAPPALAEFDGTIDDGAAPFAAHVEVGPTPWREGHRLARIGLKGIEVDLANRPAANLVFLIDVSGSMSDQNKLPLVKQSLKALVDNLGVDDRVAIVTYAGNSQIALDSTAIFERDQIHAAIEGLSSGGSTNGGAGIAQAYDIATKHFVPSGINRVILATDGDFNVGVTDDGQLTRLIEDRAKSGVFLSVLGFGMGNIKDDRLESLSNRGNGNYAYIDNYDEAHRALVERLGGTLITIAKDVKIQVEFNPAEVAAYRLIGYENRLLAAEDFNDDTKDAGEIGSGHTVTALYEIVPTRDRLAMDAEDDAGEVAADAAEPAGGAVDPLRYQRPAALNETALESGELFTLKIRYKAPDGDTSELLEFPVEDDGRSLDATSADFRLAAAAAEFGMLLRGSPYAGTSSFDGVAGLVSLEEHEHDTTVAEFLKLAREAKRILTPEPEGDLREE